MALVEFLDSERHRVRYLRQPFRREPDFGVTSVNYDFAELLARIEALARRSAAVVKETVFRVEDLELDLLSRTAKRSGQDLGLRPREFEVLSYLVRNQGQAVSRAMLLQHVWDLHFDPTTNIIDVYVGRVRRKVDPQHTYPLIHTVRGVGFCLRAPC